MAERDLYYSLDSNYDPVDDFLSYDDQTHLQPAGSNDSTDDIQSTAAAEVIGVALYPVVTWFAVLLTLTSVGLVGNIIVLVATTVFDEHTGRRGRLNRASKSVVVNLGVALAASCVVVGPLEFAVVAENYVKRSVSAFVCRAAAAAYHLFAGTIVSCLVLYALVRRCRLQRAADCRRSTSSKGLRSASDAGTCWASFRRQLEALCGSSAAAGAVDALPNCGRKRIGVKTVAGATVPWLVGVLCSLLASVDYSSLVEFEVCRQSVVYRKHVRHEDAYRSSMGWTGALAIIYLVVLMLAGIWLTLAYFWNRRLFASALTQHDPAMTRDRSVLSRDEGRRRTSCISAAGASSSDNGVADDDGEISRHEPSNSLKKKRMARRQSGERASKSSQDKREMEEDDDTFDMKMRMKFQKKSRSSGRRHTVANIGLPSLSGRLRRGSLSDTGLTAVAGISPSGSGSGATTPEYHYVRKWSVDITALANQLENPKAAVAGRSGSYQFAELQGALRTSPCNASRRSGSPVVARPTLPCIIAEVETTDQESAERDEDATSKQSNRSHPDSKAGATESGNTGRSSPTKRCRNEAAASKKNNSDHTEGGKQKTDSVHADVEQAESPVEAASVEGSDFSWPAATASSGAGARSKRRAELRQLHNAVEHVSSLPLDPPSIIVSGLNVDDGHEPCSTNSDEEDDFSGKDQIWTTSEAAANQDIAVSEEQSSTVTYDGSALRDDGQLRRVRRELQRAVRTFAMLMVCAALVLPFACVSVWNGVTAVRYVGYNLSLAATALMALTAAVIPPLLVWSDRHLCARVVRMWALATRLRCVCHCHIGHGKNCFQRPRTSRRDL